MKSVAALYGDEVYMSRPVWGAWIEILFDLMEETK